MTRCMEAVAAGAAAVPMHCDTNIMNRRMLYEYSIYIQEQSPVVR